jgi:multidrug resistance efflux pump
MAADQAAGPSSTTIEADQSAIRSAQQQVDNLTLQIQGSDATASDTQQQNSLKLSQATASLQAAQAKLSADLLADPALPAETISADHAAVAAAQFQVDTTNLQIQAANTQATLTSRQNALKLQQAQEALKLAQDKLTADQVAGPSSTTIAADQSAIRAAQRQVDSLTLSAKNNAANATAQIASASQSLTATKNAYALKVAGATAAQIEADRASVANAQESVRQAQSTLDGATLTSPADGLVVAVNVVSGTIAPSGSAITLESGPMVVTAAFAESDIPSIEVGQAASVTVTALKKDVAGKVTRINPVAAGTGSSSVVTYQVQVTLDTADPGMRVGMSASVAVTTAQAANVIAVPSIALSGSDGSYAVQVVDANGQAQLVSVQVGLVTSSMAEIQSGLEVGETVVIGSSTQRTGGTTTTGGGFGFPVGGGGRTQP